MESKEKQILVTIICSIAVFVGYALYVYYKYIAGNFDILYDLRFLGKAFFVFIPVAIVSQIIIHIVFAIISKIVTNEDVDTKSDERDKLIELKSIRISHWLFTLGFMLAMATLALGMPVYLMFVVLVFSGFISSIISEIVKLFYYKRGF